tara:strand:- start:133 stop:357 length:225 start_codon:yes stop_codon:yes gene_type:complete
MKYFNHSKLKEKIKGSGLKANYIAETLGLHRITLTFYCTGRRNPKKETLKTIARLCRCKLGDFYDTEKEYQEKS